MGIDYSRTHIPPDPSKGDVRVATVADLADMVDTRNENFEEVSLAGVELQNDGLHLRGSNNLIEFDEIAINHLSRYLKIAPKYIGQCPRPLQQENINYWLDQYRDTEAVFHTIGHSLKGVYSPTKKIIPMSQVMGVISRVFQPDDNVVSFDADDDQIHLDVIASNLSIEVPGYGTQERPHVGDITHGGIRFFVYPNQEKAPSVETYFNRLICTNGMSSPTKEHEIRLRGNTVEEVLESLEKNAQTLLKELPEKLDEYRHTAEIHAPEKVGEFAYQLTAEHGLPHMVVDRVMNNLAALPQEPSVYDIIQGITSIANEDVSFKNKIKIQRLGGQLAMRTEQTLHRCGTCERPL